MTKFVKYLTRKQVSLKYGIPLCKLKHWSSARYNGDKPIMHFGNLYVVDQFEAFLEALKNKENAKAKSANSAKEENQLKLVK